MRPCQCCGTTKWVHQVCLQRWIDERQAGNSTTKVSCPQCGTQYVIIFPPLGIFLQTVEDLDKFVNKVCPLCGSKCACWFSLLVFCHLRSGHHHAGVGTQRGTCGDGESWPFISSCGTPHHSSHSNPGKDDSLGRITCYDCGEGMLARCLCWVFSYQNLPSRRQEPLCASLLKQLLCPTLSQQQGCCVVRWSCQLLQHLLAKLDFLLCNQAWRELYW